MPKKYKNSGEKKRNNEYWSAVMSKKFVHLIWSEKQIEGNMRERNRWDKNVKKEKKNETYTEWKKTHLYIKEIY